MKRKIIFLFFIITLISYRSSFAILSMELTQGLAGAIPIIIIPFSNDQSITKNISGIINNDLQNSGRFKVYDKTSLTAYPHRASDVSVDYFRRLGIDHVVIGGITVLSSDRYQVNMELLDIFREGQTPHVVLKKQYTIDGNELRTLAHHLSDLIYEKITGIKGIFSTKLVYVLTERLAKKSRYTLEISDQDGYGSKTLLHSAEPIMSPAWSPNGKHVAYVSFEKRQAAIYLQEVSTGGRRLLSEFPGINGAPAWSPDGRKLALVLSKGGSPNIYLMDIQTKKLTALTNDFYINTEPAFSPDGRFLLFTSNRSGNPQIYQMNLTTNSSSRITFDGSYNARASFTQDGRKIALIHRLSNIYHIAILDLNSGKMRVLNSRLGDSSSPSMAPNGTMVLYDMVSKGRNVLGMASADGSIQLLLPFRHGDAQDPAWSPFL